MKKTNNSSPRLFQAEREHEMTDVTVYHPHHPEINNGYTVFSGESIVVAVNEDGSLLIENWCTNTAMGYAIFAKGIWTYVVVSENKS
jgi:hypothetical protein